MMLSTGPTMAQSTVRSGFKPSKVLARLTKVSSDGDGDAYAFLNTSMDRKETITEVEEPTKKVFIGLRERGDYLAVPPEEGYVEAEIFGMGRCKLVPN